MAAFRCIYKEENEKLHIFKMFILVEFDGHFICMRADQIIHVHYKFFYCIFLVY